MTTDNENKVTPLWERTNDPQGIRPTFPILCAICSGRDHRSEMVLRRSRIHQVADMRIRRGVDTYRPYAFDMAYKCPECGWYTVFGIAVPTDFAQETIRLREGSTDFFLPEEVWEDDERVQKQLAACGYFGGSMNE